MSAGPGHPRGTHIEIGAAPWTVPGVIELLASLPEGTALTDWSIADAGAGYTDLSMTLLIPPRPGT